MSLTYAELAHSVAEVAALVRGRLENVWQVGSASVVLAIHTPGAKSHVLLCAEPRFARIHLLREGPGESGEAGPFARAVRQAVRGRSLGAVRLAEDDRIVEFAFGRPEEPAGRLIAELTGRACNVILVGPTGHVVAALKPARKSGGVRSPAFRRSSPSQAGQAPTSRPEDQEQGTPEGSIPTPPEGGTTYPSCESGFRKSANAPRKSARDLRPGAPYERPAPPAPALLSTEDRFADAVASGAAASYGEAIERLYAAGEAEEAVRTLRSALAAHLKTLRKKAERLLGNLEADRDREREPDRLRLIGELLKLHLGQIPLRESLVTLRNDFAPGSPDIEVELLPRLSPRENMERYFQRYKRSLASREAVGARAATARARLAAIDAASTAAQAATTLEELGALAEEWGIRRPAAEPRRREAGQSKSYFQFTSADGLAILVGRSAAGNDELTFGVAHGNDLWLHAEGYRGPHVVVRVPEGKSVPKETLLDAATLAVHFGELRRAGGGPVLYGLRKYVTKPRRAAPGKVLCTQGKTLRITVERSRLDRLMHGPEGRDGKTERG